MMDGRHFTIQRARSGKLLAESIQASLLSSTKRENKRAAKSINNIYIVDNVEIPLCLVECGFLSNPEEASLLTTDEYQDKIAFGIFVGITDYFNNVQ